MSLHKLYSQLHAQVLQMYERTKLIIWKFWNEKKLMLRQLQRNVKKQNTDFT